MKISMEVPAPAEMRERGLKGVLMILGWWLPYELRG
jgi:hypothetical protein